MSAVIRPNEKPRQLDRKAEAGVLVSDADVADTTKLTRLLARIVSDLADLRRRFWPEHLDFEDLALPAGGSVTLTHGFGGRVRWWVVDATGDIPELLRDADKTTDLALVLTSDVECVATIRVEEAG